MKKRFLWEILDDVAQGKDLISIFTVPGRSPARVWEALGLLVSMEGSTIFRKVASKYMVDPSYLLHRVQGLIHQLETLREEDPYSILGVGYTASPSEIHQKWKELMREWHPDKRGGSSEAHEMCRKINEAYDLLKDRERRREYDRRFLPLLSILKGLEEGASPATPQRSVAKWILSGVLGVLVCFMVAVYLSSGTGGKKSGGKSSKTHMVARSSSQASSAGGKGDVSGKKVPLDRDKSVVSGSSSPSKVVASFVEKKVPNMNLDMEGFRSLGTGSVNEKPSPVKERGLEGPAPLRKRVATVAKAPKIEVSKSVIPLEAPKLVEAGTPSRPQRRKRTIRRSAVRLVEKGPSSGSKRKAPVKRKEKAKVAAVSQSSAEMFKERKQVSQPLHMESPTPRASGSKSLVSPFSVVEKFIEAYRGEDLVLLFSLFTSDALENGQPIIKYVARYRQFFQTFKILDYRLVDGEVVPSSERVRVHGSYLISLIPRSGGNLHWVRGAVTWTLVKEKDGRWLISSLDYTVE